jgi:hypothetical protein
MNWSGAATGTADCTGASSSESFAIATSPTVSWNVDGDSGQHKVTFGFTLAKPPTAMTVNVTSADFLSIWLANSKTPAAGASCSITLDSVTEDTSGGVQSKFLVHGTATATAVNAGDSSTVTVDVTF